MLISAPLAGRLSEGMAAVECGCPPPQPLLLPLPRPLASSRSMPDVQPKAGSNPAAFLYWFAFITLCSFFVLNLCELRGWAWRARAFLGCGR